MKEQELQLEYDRVISQRMNYLFDKAHFFHSEESANAYARKLARICKSYFYPNVA